MAGEQPADDASTSVFVSYAHADARWVEEFSTYLKPWVRDRRVRLWDDRDIGPGADWRSEIDRALEDAAVAVLIVTPSLLASDFVMDVELPTILDRVAQGRARIAWIAVEPAAFDATALREYQAVNDPSRPLSTLPRPERQQTWVHIARTIATSMTLRTLASSLAILDETYEPLEATAQGRTELVERSYSIVAELQPQEREISFSGGYQKIGYDELVNLPAEDHEFIQDLEESLRTNYNRWRDIRKGLGEAGGAMDTEIQDQLRRVSRLMCSDLTGILDFLLKIYKYDLEDHYGRYRYLCAELGAP